MCVTRPWPEPGPIGGVKRPTWLAHYSLCVGGSRWIGATRCTVCLGSATGRRPRVSGSEARRHQLWRGNGAECGLRVRGARQTPLKTLDYTSPISTERRCCAFSYIEGVLTSARSGARDPLARPPDSEGIKDDHVCKVIQLRSQSLAMPGIKATQASLRPEH